MLNQGKREDGLRLGWVQINHLVFMSQLDHHISPWQATRIKFSSI